MTGRLSGCIDSFIATGICDKDNEDLELKENNNSLFIETPLPFFYLIFSMDNMVPIVINRKEITLMKNQCVFIKKSIPFSILLDWKLNGLQRPDICAVRFTGDSISNFNVLHDSQFEKLKISTGEKKPDVQDYYFFDLSNCDHQELETIRWMVSQSVMNNMKDKHKETDSSITLAQTVQNFILAKLLNENYNIGYLYHEPSFEITSERVARLIMRDYSINWTNDEIASELHISAALLKKKMYEEVGSISVFIHKIKLTECLRRIRRTNDQISHISHDMGYCSSSYFAKIFKRYFGVYPSDIRVNDKSK